MMTDPRLDQFDDRALMRILSQVTEELHEEFGDLQESNIRSEEDARGAIVAVMNTGPGLRGVDDADLLSDSSQNTTVARVLLTCMLDDARTRPVVERTLVNPPGDDQKSVELAIGAAVILGALVTWLQTSVDISVKREGGKTTFHVDIRKDASNKKTIGDIVKVVAHVFGG